MKFDTLYKLMVNEDFSPTFGDDTEEDTIDGEGELDADVGGYDPADIAEAQEVLGLTTGGDFDPDDLNPFELKAYATLAIEKGYIARIKSGDMTPDEAMVRLEDTDYPKYKLQYKETKGGFTGIKGQTGDVGDATEFRMSPDEAKGLGATPEFDENPAEAGFEN